MFIMRTLIFIIVILTVFNVDFSSEVIFQRCGDDADCAPFECCASEMTVEANNRSPTISWKCKMLGKVGQICNNFSNQYCKCDSDLHCQATGSWFFGSGICVDIFDNNSD